MEKTLEKTCTRFFYRVTETRVEVSENEEFWGTRAVVQ